MGFIHTINTNGFTPKKGYDFKAMYITDTDKGVSKTGFYGRTAEEAEDALITWMDGQGIIQLTDCKQCEVCY